MNELKTKEAMAEEILHDIHYSLRIAKDFEDIFGAESALEALRHNVYNLRSSLEELFEEFGIGGDE